MVGWQRVVQNRGFLLKYPTATLDLQKENSLSSLSFGVEFDFAHCAFERPRIQGLLDFFRICPNFLENRSYDVRAIVAIRDAVVERGFVLLFVPSLESYYLWIRIIGAKDSSSQGKVRKSFL